MKETILQFFRDNFLGSQWFTGWASLISIIGVLYALYKDWVWSKKGIPFYALRTFPLLSSNANAIPGLKVLFNGKNVKSLSSTKFILWNGGHDVIRKEDIPSGSQIQLELKGRGEILQATLEKQNKPTNKFSCNISPDRKTLCVSFEFFNHGQGAVFHILHTCLSDSDITVTGETMQGTKIASKELLRMRRISKLSGKRRYKNLMRFVLVTYGIGMILMPLWGKQEMYDPQNIEEIRMWTNIITMIVGVVMVLIGLFVFKTVVPKSLDEE